MSEVGEQGRHVNWRSLTMKIAIYSRKSKFTGKGESIGNQIELCKDYIRKHLDDVTDEQIEIFEDEGFSGKNMARPEFQRMLSLAHKREFDYIICYRLDRISRNVSDFSSLIEDLQHYKTAFICIKEQFDTSNPMGRAMMYIASVFAQLERETIAERIRDNMLLLARTGRWLGGTTPIGFKSELIEKETTDGKIRTSFKLSPVKDDQSIVQLIFGKYLEFHSMTKVETYLLQQDIKTRLQKNFTPIALREILSNPVYCVADKAAYDYFTKHGADICFDEKDFDGKHAIMTYNRTSNEESRAQRKNDVCEWIIAIGKHKGLIDSESWIKVQAILEMNRPKAIQKKVQNSVSLLSGLLVCGNCGTFMRPRVNSNKRRDEHGNQTFSYLCDLKKKSKGARCDSPSIHGNTLDEIVCQEVLKYNEAGSLVGSKLMALKKQILNGGSSAQNALKSIQKRIEEKKSEIHSLIKVLSNSEDSTALYSYTKQEIDSLDDQIKSLTRQLHEMEEETSITNDFSEQVAIIEDSLKSFSQSFSTATVHEKRAFLRTIIEKVVWDGKEIHIFLYGESEK